MSCRTSYVGLVPLLFSVRQRYDVALPFYVRQYVGTIGYILLLVAGDGEDETNAGEHGNESGSAVGDEMEGNAREWGERYHGGQVETNLESDPGANTDN